MIYRMRNLTLRLMLSILVISCLSVPAHAAISYIGSVTDDSNNDEASLTVPASVQTDDVLLVQITIRNRNGSDGVTTPSGWTLIASQDRDDNVLQSLYYRVATAGNAGTSYTWDFDGNGNRRYVVGMSVFRGVDTSNPIDQQNSQTGMSFSSITAPSVTTTAANAMLVAFYTLEAGDQSFSPGLGMSEAYDEEENNNNNGISSMMAYVLQASAGASGDKQATASKSNDDAIGHLVALNEGNSGTSLTGSLNVDNTFIAYISTDDSVQGTLIGSGNDWPTTVDIATTLTVGQDYFLHIYATDVGGVAGFLGDFELTGIDHVFSNGLTTLNTNTSNWSVNTSDWNNYQTASGYGLNGVSPWGTRSGVDSNAEWIWSSDNLGDNINYFSTKISASVPLELQDLSGSCSVLQEVTIVYNNDVEQTSAETVGNYQLTNPSGVDININSAIRGPSNTVTLSLASTLNDLTEYTVAVNNVQNLSGEIIAAGTTSTFSLSCNLNCLTEVFSGPGGLSSSWSASSNSGSFGIPRIIDNGRLRLTDASGNVSTVATLLHQFPGAGNRIEIEFDYYAYDGSGADGIAVTFSDASVSPEAGAFGGSLGYAQKTGIDGFAGGWLGIGLDEFGNFSSASEGRDGGSGFAADSIALRGSGSGASGYPFLTSTGSLTPGIDQGGSTLGPNHRYKVSIDHTMGGREAYASVERDTGSGFVEIVPRFDVFSLNALQADVPDNWVVSLTGSTGGSVNIHEIGSFEVCAALPISPYGSPDHYEISHSSPGVTCESSEVTINAHDASHNAFTVNSNTDITVTTSPAVDSVITSPVTMLSGASTASFYLNESDVLANIDIDVTDGTASDLDDAGSEDEVFSFLDTAFRFYANGSNTDSTPIGPQIAGKPSNVTPGNQSLTLRAVRTNTDTGACEAALQGTTVVEIAYECNNPTSCTASNLVSLTGVSTATISRNDNAAATKSYTSVNMEFDSNGEAPFLFNYADAGEITLHAHKSVAANEPDPAFELIGASNSFWVSPDKLLVTAKTSGNSVINGNTVSHATKHKAGENFNLEVTAVNTSGATTPNYVPGQSQFLLDRTGPSVDGTDGGLTYGTAGSIASALSPTYQNVTLEGFNSGVSTYTLANYSEVGLLNLDLQDSNYGGAGITVPGDAIDIGRFTPDHFIVTGVNGTFDESCGAEFTYIGQDFGYDNSVALPSLTIVAQNKANATTQNYTDTNFLKLQSSGVVRVFPSADSQNGKSGMPLTLNTAPLSVFQGSILGGASAGLNEGEVKFTFNSADSYQYTKNVNSEIGNFNSDLVIAVTGVTDADGITATNLSSALEIKPAEIDIRYGRWVMKNVFGPETESMNMPAFVEYLDSITGNYILNEEDSCTNVSSLVSLNPAPSTLPFTGIVVGSGTTNFSLNGSLAGGNAGFTFSKPSSGTGGSVEVSLNLTTFPWLQYDWNGDGTLQNPPDTTATFGQYRGHDRIIYWREVQ